MKTYIVIVVMLVATNAWAQLTHTFNQIARNLHYGYALNVAVADDGTVFLADGVGGLRAYRYSDTSFTNIGYIDDGGNVRGVAVGPDGTVFLANNNDGLWAYSYDGTSFTNTAHQPIGSGRAADVAVNPNGTVFLANESDGLRAYTYDGSSFTNTAHAQIDSGEALGVAVGPDGTVFLANNNDGLRAYSYDGTSFTNTAHAQIDSGLAVDVAVGQDGTIFLANTGTSLPFSERGIDDDGLRAFVYDGSSLTNTAHIDDDGWATGVAVGSDGTVFLMSTDGLWAYSYNDTSFTNTAYNNDGSFGLGLAVNSDGIVFVASGYDGLRSYRYDGSAFINTAHINESGVAINVAADKAGNVFIINDNGNVHAYGYNGSSFSNTAYIDDKNVKYVAISSDGTIFFAGDDNLWAYSYDGTSLTNIAHISTAASVRDITVGPDGTIFVAMAGIGLPGLGAYVFNGSSFTNLAEDGGPVRGVAVGPDGTIFTAQQDLFALSYHNGVFTVLGGTGAASGPYAVAVDSEGTIFLGASISGFYAFIFDGVNFEITAAIPKASFGGYPRSIAIGPDGTVFVCANDGLRAYSYDGTNRPGEFELNKRAYINDGGWAEDVAVGPDGTVFLANGDEGLIAYTYSGYTGITSELSTIPQRYKLSQNYPNPFNPTTKINYSIPKHSNAVIRIYDVLGKEITTLVNEEKPAGNYEVVFYGRNLSSGIYFYRLQAGSFVDTKKMVLIK